ncbi:MAG: glycoside hydrolase family 3 C-terminal domain-containing protein [Lachnospiraceae bacterium]|nr:glycoside hydrolase family 3 C-terminal domain-containing protein [Lachnospiraceae bacterium]
MKCNKEHRLSYTDRAKEIIKDLTLEEKISLMGGNWSLEKMMKEAVAKEAGSHYNIVPYPAGGIDRKNLPPMLFADGPRGVVCGNGETTCYPVSMLRGASFDTDLEERIGRAIGEEVRAFGGNTFAGVCINLPYNPGWGRSQETYGEESFHIGQMGAALTKGVQSENVIACIKHYAFNQMEISRFKVSVDCDKRTEREVFLPHFKDCIDAGAASVMSSYNLYRSIHCGHHNYLLNQVLKKEWDFDGFVMSDFVWGVKDTVEAANGGQDIEMCCTQFFGEKLVKAVKDGFVPESKIDDAALRIVRTLLAYTEADNKEYPKETYVGNSEHIALAEESARKGITLLQNRNNVLPLRKEAVKSVALIGKLGKKEVIGDWGSSRVYPAYIVTPYQGLMNVIGDKEIIYCDGSNINEAISAARIADAVIFVAGYDHNDEGEYIAEDPENGYTEAEGGDRMSLGLHPDEIELIKKVGPVNQNSAVVLIGGNMIMMTEWKDSVNAILMAYYAGQEGGNVIAKILFGDINPSGKLPFVVPYKESDLPQVKWDTDSQWYDYYHGYTKLEKEGVEPLLPFGFGLSYTQFSLAEPSFTADEKNVYANCKVKNTGAVDGTQVVQMYVGFENSHIDRPLKVLRGFTRVDLKAGEEKEVKLSCPIEKLMWYNPAISGWELEHMDYELYIGFSSDNKDLVKGTIIL